MMIKIRIRDLNPHVVCSLCAGYFISATTINECLHTFCKSCLILFLQTSKSCPQCGVRIHETQPHQHLKADHALQDIVFKLLPDLRQREEERIDEFYHSRGLPRELQRDDDYKVQKLPLLSNCFDPTAHLYSKDDQIIYALQPYSLDSSKSRIHSKMFCSSVRTCVHHLKKLLANQLDSENNLTCESDSLDIPVFHSDVIEETNMNNPVIELNTQLERNSRNDIHKSKVDQVEVFSQAGEYHSLAISHNDLVSEVDLLKQTANTDLDKNTVSLAASNKQIGHIDLVIRPDVNPTIKMQQSGVEGIDSSVLGVDGCRVKNSSVNLDTHFQIIIGSDILLNDDCSLYFAKIIYDNLVGEKNTRLVLKYRIKES